MLAERGDWQAVPQIEDDAHCLEGTGPLGRSLRILWGDDVRTDGRTWREVQVSVIPYTTIGWGERALPTWREMEWVRYLVIGAEREAYQTHPSRVPHRHSRRWDDDKPNFVSITYLYLLACMDDPTGEVLPRRVYEDEDF
jgi:hypothetical protein